MNTFPILLGTLCVFALAYRYYSAFIAAKVLVLDDRRTTPAHVYEDGHNYVPSPKWVLFGHHFAAIAGAGPLVGPTLAAQFGFAPGLFWSGGGRGARGLRAGLHGAGGLGAAQGQSLADIARTEDRPLCGSCDHDCRALHSAGNAGRAGNRGRQCSGRQSLGRIHHRHDHPHRAGHGGCTCSRARRARSGSPAPALWASSLLLAAVVGGHFVAASSCAACSLSRRIRSRYCWPPMGLSLRCLPVWLLLAPRDYLSTYVKLGTIALLILGIFIVHPAIQFPAVTQFIHGGGPIIKGKLFPFLFVTIACGAISGFHSLISSGTTPKMLWKETDARFIGYGAMMCEGIVAVLALIAACSMYPGDYFAINATPAVFAKLGLHTVNLDMFSAEVGEKLAGRTGGAVSLAVGMAQIFRGLPGMKTLTSYWYHYAIMFEALFILTTVDTGTRVARYVLHELLGKIHKPFSNTAWLPGNLVTSAFVVLSWGYMIYTGSISTIWPLFGTGNQLLATIALAVVTTFLVNMGKAKYAWITAVPMCFVGVTTLTAGMFSIKKSIFHWPANRGRHFRAI